MRWSRRPDHWDYLRSSHRGIASTQRQNILRRTGRTCLRRHTFHLLPHGRRRISPWQQSCERPPSHGSKSDCVNTRWSYCPDTSTSMVRPNRLDARREGSRWLIAGLSNSHFHQLFNPSHTTQVLQNLDADPTVAILGLNDDIDSGYDEVKALMGTWFEKRWPTKLAWERGSTSDS